MNLKINFVTCFSNYVERRISYISNYLQVLLDFSILFGFIVGVVLALPPGPVGVTAIEIGLYQNKKAGFQLALGNAIMDFIYCLGVIFATSAVISTLGSFSQGYPAAYIVFQLGAIAALLIMGFQNLKVKTITIKKGEEATSGYASKISKKGPLFLGIAIALTNLANPTFLPSLAAVTIWVHGAGMTTGGAISNFLFALGFGLGNLFWVDFLATMTNKYKDKFSPKLILRIKQVAGGTFVGFGLYLAYRLVSLTDWSEVFRAFN